MSRLYKHFQNHLLTRFLYFFSFHLLFWFVVFETLYAIWPDPLEAEHWRNLTLAALLGTINTILLHGVAILSGPKSDKSS